MKTVLPGSMLALSLVVFGAARFPESISNGGATSFIIAVVGLMAYAAAAFWSRRSRAAATQTAVRVGTICGVGIAIVAIANHAIELWETVPPSVGAIVGAGMWGLMFLGFGTACTLVLARQLPVASGLLASAWCAMTMSILLIDFALAVGFTFMPHMQNVLSVPYATSGMTDARAFVTRHLIRSASQHLFIAPMIALFVGVLSAAAYYVLARLARRLALVLSSAVLLLLVGGAASIAHASSLQRSSRPPFIGLGLASLAIALVSVHPLVIALLGRKNIA